ncbi:VOC family protein [Sphingomonas sp. DT-207]|uniref:VOC family protein n=1 Tax=Sphingomonas sp. DT-207 TaxID=3396167 RepID=UPI003F1CF32F
MFRDLSSSAIVAVSDIERARSFYGETLGLEATDTSEDMLTYRTGDTQLIVYRSDAAGSNKANAVVWSAPAGFEAAVTELRSNGVRFEEYPELGMAITDGVHAEGDFRGVWFKDPDGNILHLVNM